MSSLTHIDKALHWGIVQQQSVNRTLILCVADSGLSHNSRVPGTEGFTLLTIISLRAGTVFALITLV